MARNSTTDIAVAVDADQRVAGSAVEADQCGAIGGPACEVSSSVKKMSAQ